MKSLLIILLTIAVTVVTFGIARAVVKGSQKNARGEIITWESEINPFELKSWHPIAMVQEANGLIRIKIVNPDVNAKIKTAHVWVYRLTNGRIILIAYAYTIDRIDYYYFLKKTSEHSACYKQLKPLEM